MVGEANLQPIVGDGGQANLQNVGLPPLHATMTPGHPPSPPTTGRGFMWLTAGTLQTNIGQLHCLAYSGHSDVIKIFLNALKPRKQVMDRRRPYEEFTCPKCGSDYKLVRVPAAADSREPPLHCKVCNQEFASTDGENILKYFLVSRRRRSRTATFTAAQ